VGTGSNVDNLNSVRHDASTNLRNKKKTYLEAKIEELETNRNVVTRGVVAHRCH
jgi:hypothetical protein